jgi:hypothetical protein
MTVGAKSPWLRAVVMVLPTVAGVEKRKNHSPKDPLTHLLVGGRSLLDSLQANVFIADMSLTLVYMNPAAEAALRMIEGEIRASFHLSVAELLDGSIHRFHRDPARIEKILETPGAMPHAATFAFGNVTLYTQVNELVIEGKRHGYIVAWENHSLLTKAKTQVDETTSALESAAAAVAQLASAISDTARHASDASGIAREAVSASQGAAFDVGALGEASGEIDKVVRAITAVAEQTKLLALNATIEAARAGEAGKGFAVVASEVKELATTTSSAALDISGRIREIKARVDEVVAAIGRIEGVIGRIDEAQTSIAAVVEEQSAVTNDLARQIQVAATQSHATRLAFE